MGNVEAKEFVYTTQGHEIRGGCMGMGGGCRVEGNKGGEMGQL